MNRYSFNEKEKQNLENNTSVCVEWRVLKWTITPVGADGTSYEVSIEGDILPFMRERGFVFRGKAAALQDIPHEMQCIYSDWEDRIEQDHSDEIERCMSNPAAIEGSERALKAYDMILGAHVYRACTGRTRTRPTDVR